MAKDFADELMADLRSYCGDVGERISKEAEKRTKAARLELKTVSPKATGEYSKSWRLRKYSGSKRFRVIVYNDVYQLTHLLENGFVHHPDMKEIEGKLHIEPVQEKLNKEFESACERIIKNT